MTACLSLYCLQFVSAPPWSLSLRVLKGPSLCHLQGVSALRSVAFCLQTKKPLPSPFQVGVYPLLGQLLSML